MLDYKHIHIGGHIKKIAEIRNISIARMCLSFECSYNDIQKMYNQVTLDSGILLKWCKLLDYNFFMIYHSHLQLYAPKASVTKLNVKKRSKHNEDYVFRKNLYSPEIIGWILDKLQKNELSISEVISTYNIPRTTIYRWKKKQASFLVKHKKDE